MRTFQYNTPFYFFYIFTPRSIYVADRRTYIHIGAIMSYIELLAKILKCSTQAGFVRCLYGVILSGFKDVNKDEPTSHC
jgi:hypothetical protein